MAGHFKDDILDRLARQGNVAQFVSFGPDLGVRHVWIRGFPQGERFASLEEAVGALLTVSPEGSVNIRSWQPDDPKNRSFFYGRKEPGEILAELRRLAADGLYTIVNETIDVEDGGVSGVAFGDLLEFAPGDTPRCVEKPGACALPRDLGFRVLETVYGFQPALPERREARVEWTIHPLKRGYRREHTTLWEMETPGPPPVAPRIEWPHRFSRHLGDKAFGLVIADALGLSVPRTMVFPRRLAPFTFGTGTGSSETWLRTCPLEQVPGRFTTHRGWIDPFRLLREEDPEGDAIASVLAQEGVDARHSGALLAGPDGEPLVEGVVGRGDDFMLGRKPPEELPAGVESSLKDLYRRAAGRLGAVRFEWVHDGARPWIVQLHRGAAVSSGRVIFPGDAEIYRSLEISQGIDALRELIAKVQGTEEGIVLLGRVGVTSHFGDLLRRARIPSRIEEERT